jgi:tetratricopeptide (TPR) repeat protein
MLLKDWNQAIAHYTSACDLRREEIDIGNVRYHLGEAYYCSGNKEIGRELLLQGLAEIRTKSPELDPFLSRVWESGCLMRLYDLEYSYAPMSELNEYIDKAQEIIDADPRLILRKKQLRQLLETKPKLG